MRLEKMILGQLMIGECQGTCRGPAITTTIAFANLLKYVEDLLTSKGACVTGAIGDKTQHFGTFC